MEKTVKWIVIADDDGPIKFEGSPQDFEKKYFRFEDPSYKLRTLISEVNDYCRSSNDLYVIYVDSENKRHLYTFGGAYICFDELKLTRKKN